MFSFLHWLKGHLPSSKRAVADLRAQVYSLQNQVNILQSSLNEQCAALRDAQINMTKTLRDEILTNREQSSIMDWANYQREDEDYLSARKRLFSSLPKASGAMRLVQRGCAGLLSEFSEIAKKHDLPYWVDFGTLIGCVRHSGFIPWDDDVDLGMMREDISRFLTILREDSDLRSRYKAVLVYDPYVCCRQLRFRYQNEANPCFLDIFFYDYAPAYTFEQKNRFVQLRKQLQEELRSKPYFKDWIDGGYLQEGKPNTDEIESLFRSYQQKAVAEGIVVGKSDAKSVVYGIDNVEAENLYCSSFDEIFPVKSAIFEDFSVFVPRQAEKILERAYGNIYQLPADIVTHYRHVDRESLQNQQIVDAIEGCIRSNPYAESFRKSSES